jgi:glucarate dehydratase
LSAVTQREGLPVNADLKIKHVTVTEVSVPTIRTCTWSLGRSYGHTRSIVEVETHGGIIGLGEAPTHKVAPLIRENFAERLVGISAAEPVTARIACLGTHRDYGYLADPLSELGFSAIEVALWDILGKALGVPLYRLLGGAVRKHAPFGAYAYTVDIDEGHALADVPGIMAEIARTSIATTRANLFEFKVGRHPVDCDIATVEAVREAVGPEVNLAVDANLAMSIDDARRFFDATRAAKLAMVEEPVALLQDMERLRADFLVPISTHCTDPEKLRAFPIIDAIVGDLNVDGGIRGVTRTAVVIRSMGKRFWLRSNGETGIGGAALCHLGIACPELDRPAQWLGNWCEDDLIEGERWQLRDGGIKPPELPGLGVTIDQAALKHYSGKFKTDGAFSRYDKR